MAKADPKSTAHYRTPPGQPKRHLGAMFERTAPDGTRHFFGFIGGLKLLLFPTGETSSGGDPKWTLYSQSLNPADTKQLPPDDPARVDVDRFRPFPAEAPAEFVSGLPDRGRDR